MVNIKKMDEKDFVFINKPLTELEEKEFSEFLKAHKSKVATRKLMQRRAYRQHKANKIISQPNQD